MLASNTVDVESRGSTAGYIPSSAIDLLSTTVESK